MLQCPGSGHAQCHGDRVGGVSGNKRIVDALIGLWEAGETAKLTQSGEQLLASGDGFVDITLVSNIKYKAVYTGIKYPVNGYRQFYRAQIGGQMPAGLGDIFQQKGPQLLTELRQLLFIQCFDVRRRVNMFEKHRNLLTYAGHAGIVLPNRQLLYSG